MQHVKPHGALYNQAAADPSLAGAIARATAKFSSDLALYGLASSEPMAAAAAEVGLRFVPEAFADRRYLADGSLQPRSEPGSSDHRPRGRRRAGGLDRRRWHRVQAADGSPVALRAESICCHGDTPGAVEIAAAVRRALEGEGVTVGRPRRSVIRPFGEAALLVELPSSDLAQALAASLRDDPPPGLIEAVPGLESLLVELDPLRRRSGAGLERSRGPRRRPAAAAAEREAAHHSRHLRRAGPG